MDYIPCRERKFPLKLAAEFVRCYSDYVDWLIHLLERLGREATLEVWDDASSNADDALLADILAAGWEELEGERTDVEGQISQALAQSFALPIEETSIEEARRIIERSRPISQIRQCFRHLDQVRQSTTYEWLHVFRGGFASLVESLIDRHGRQGELIAYDVMTGKAALAPQETMSAEAFLKLLAVRHDPSTRQGAGLEYEHVRVADSEVVIHIKECEWARYYLEHHPRVGYLMACSGDEWQYRGINPRIRMQRTQTLMEGGALCDFRIYVAGARDR